MKTIWIFLFGALLWFNCSGCGKRPADKESAQLKNMLQSYDASKWTQLLDQSNALLKESPDNTSALIFRSLAAEKLGKRDLALASAEAATRLDPENFMAQYTLGRLYAASPDSLSDAGTPLINALKLQKEDRNTLVLLVNVSSGLHSVRLLNYLKELEKIAPEVAKTPEFLNLAGIACAEQRNIKDAAKYFFEAYRNAKDSPQIVFNTAVFIDHYYKTPKKAIPFYHRYLKLAAKLPEHKEQCAVVRARLKRIR